MTEALASYMRAVDLARAGDAPVLLCHALRHVSVDLANGLRVQALAADPVQGTLAAAPLWREARTLYRDGQIEDGVRECDQHLDHKHTEH